MPLSTLISIITVTYNAEKVIDKTLKSLKSQTFKDFEHLVIDGDSSDQTLEIIKKADLPQSTIVCEPDKGLYDAMNKGLRLAKGKYVIFLNAGDSFSSQHSLTHYAEAAIKGANIIYGDTDIVDHNGGKIGSRHLSAPPVLTKKSYADGMLVCHQAFMVKKNIALFYDLNYRFSSDYDWCINCISQTSPEDCVNLREVTVNYLSNGMTDKNKCKSLRERFKIMINHYGISLTLYKHLTFIFRALKRGNI